MKIAFIQTGGTIDKDYPKSTKGYAFEFGEPATRRILEKLNPSFDYEILTTCQKDSLDITDNDRQDLVTLINKNPANKFIITHGTDTMIETANFISSKIKNKVIVLTGAMRPEQFSNSDASVNVGGAIAAIQILNEGVYLFMTGILKSYDKIKRDISTGKFY
ncbi:MAG: asparaginase domain-containing protein [Saprospiraceae bacterium]|nr:asparaginase [Saprospiraceae bacterium]MDG1435802.1 asparaginase domain-containing protein [Saprospiraceae bacterium]MDG2418895.1 asparaginase domain-containing protein [Saprospiraceae bacterium]